MMTLVQHGRVSADEVITTWFLDRLRRLPAKGRRASE